MTRVSPATRFAIRFIQTYKREVSPRLHPRCSLALSCSTFALEMYRRHGFWAATGRTARRIYVCSRSHGTRTATAGSKRRSLRLAAIAMFVVGSILSFIGSAVAEVTPGCSASINSQGLAGRSSSNPNDAIFVKQRTAVPVSGTSSVGVSQVRIKLEYAGIRWPIKDAATSGTSWQSTVEVDRYAKYGVGLYKIVAESSGGQACVASSLINVQGNPLGTAAGIAGATMVAVGGIGMVTSATASAREGSQFSTDYDREREQYESRERAEQSAADDEWRRNKDEYEKRQSQERYEKEHIPEVRGILKLCAAALLPAFLLTGVAMMTVPGSSAAGRPAPPRVGWKPRLSLLGSISGVLLGLGSMILVQQYAIAYPTRNLALAFVLGGVLLVGAIVPSIFRIFAVRRINRQLAAGARFK